MIDRPNDSEVIMRMVAVVLYKVDDADPVSQLPFMRLDNSLKVLRLIRPAVDKNILVWASFDMLEAKNGTISIKFGHLLKGKGVDVWVDC